MVRLIVPPGERLQVFSVNAEGPIDLVYEQVELPGFAGVQTSGEFFFSTGVWHKTLPYLREEMAISFPICIIIAGLIGMTWLRRIV